MSSDTIQTPDGPRMDRVPCPACGGEGFHVELGDIDRNVGGFIEHHYPCRACGGTGSIEEEVQAVTEADLDDRDDEDRHREPEFEAARRRPYTQREFL